MYGSDLFSEYPPEVIGTPEHPFERFGVRFGYGLNTGNRPFGTISIPFGEFGATSIPVLDTLVRFGMTSKTGTQHYATTSTLRRQVSVS